jgi:hypothetical protein
MSSSELSEWESENEAPTLERPIFKSVEAGKVIEYLSHQLQLTFE